MIVTLIYFVFIMGIIILVHEFGHFIFSKMFGVYVYEFSIGMGPKIWGTKEKKSKKGKQEKTPFNIRAIPIGGYVSLAGEDAESEEDKKIPDDQKLYKKPKLQRFIILIAGIFNNFLLALFVLFLIGIVYGSPIMTPVVTNLSEEYPMYKAGIRENDKFVSINGKKVSTIDDAQIYIILAQGEKESTFVMERDGKKTTYKVKPVEEKDETGAVTYKFGITFETKFDHGFIPAVKYSFIKVGALVKQMCIVLKALFMGKLGLDNLSGPVGIYRVVGEAKEYGFVNILSLIAALSVNVGFINLLPFPAFDGGRIFFLIIEAIKGSPVSPKIENMVHTIGFIILITLMIVVTCSDVFKIIREAFAKK